MKGERKPYLEVWCRHCGAPAGEWCREEGGPNGYGPIHSLRLADAPSPRANPEREEAGDVG
jgi:hypothetical protein